MRKCLAIGDSLTYGFPYAPGQSWVHLTAEALSWTIYNRGVCGETTGDILWRLKRELPKLDVELAVIMGGTNDAFGAVRPEEVLENVAAMVAVARSRRVEPLIGLPPPVNDPETAALLDRYRLLIGEYCREQKVMTLDFYPAMARPEGSGLRPGLHCDGVHPNEAGYRKMAEEAQRLLLGLGFGE